jgi:hypothetical protein
LPVGIASKRLRGCWITSNLGQAIQFRRMPNVAQIHFSKEVVRDFLRNQSITFPNIRHLPDIGFALNASYGAHVSELQFTYRSLRSENSLRSESVARREGNAVKVVKPLSRRGQWLFPPNGYSSLGIFAKCILLTTCWAETSLIFRIELRLRELKSSEPPAHTRRFRGTMPFQIVWESCAEAAANG